MSKNLREHNFFGFDATVVADSLNSFDDRLTTMVVTFPRIVLAEFNTHRMFSRNSASSRAIPYKKMVERVKSNPFIPIAWQKDHTGMQGTEYFTSETEILFRTQSWLKARDNAITQSLELDAHGVTKQICNRLLEPFLYHTVVVSATEFENFFALRCPQYSHQGNEPFRSWKDLVKDAMDKGGSRDWVDGLENHTTIERLLKNKSGADIHIQPVAEAMWDAFNSSTPKLLASGEWHLPFKDEIDDLKLEDLLESYPFARGENRSVVKDQLIRKIATALCARLSYGNITVDGDYEKDVALYDRLHSVKHASPFEHCARVMDYQEYFTWFKGKADDYYSHSAHSELQIIDDTDEPRGYGWCLNFKGFIQERALTGLQ